MATKTIQSTVAFQDPQGNVLANGTLVFDLSQECLITSGGGQVAPSRVTVTLTSAGVIPNSTTIWANDQLTPSGTVYYVRFFNSNGLLVAGPLAWSIVGASPIDLSQMVPVSTGNVSIPSFFLNSNGTTQTGAHVVSGTVALFGGTAVISLTGAAAFTNSATYACVATDQTTGAAVTVTQAASSITFNGTGTHVISYVAVGT
jgi:hypothetical protein